MKAGPTSVTFSGYWEVPRQFRLLPSASISAIIAPSSASVGCCPSARMHVPRSPIVILSLPSLSYSWNTSLISEGKESKIKKKKTPENTIFSTKYRNFHNSDPPYEIFLLGKGREFVFVWEVQDWKTSLISEGKQTLSEDQWLKQIKHTFPAQSAKKFFFLWWGGWTFVSPCERPNLYFAHLGESWPDHVGQGPISSNFARGLTNGQACDECKHTPKRT